jgi:predicted RNase H-related nuclease YkuK (DUF458 family)
MKIFKKIDGTRVDVVKHTLDVIRENPDVKIHIGTDSQNVSHQTVYATVIAYRYGTRGVHYIYYKERVSRIRDLWTRLWKEAEMTIEVAEWFKEKVGVNIKVDLDMDFNEDAFFESNKLISAAKGWGQSLGYTVNVKPNIQIATKAADYQCR